MRVFESFRAAGLTPRGAPRLALSLLLLGTAGFAGCRGATARPVASPDPSIMSGSIATAVPLIIRNRGYFDVNVYVHRAQRSPGRRVGTITSGSTQTFRIPEAELQAGGLLMLGVRAIAGRSTWVSPALQVGTGHTARLDVMSDNSGNLSQTALYMEAGR
jgi:hypothetical protein